MRFLFPLLLVLITACGCKVIKDPVVEPLSLKQHRAEVKLDNQIFVGLAGTTNRLQDLQIRTLSGGDFKIVGEDDCGYGTGFGFNGFGWTSFNMGALPDRDVCIYRIHVRINNLDGPAGGVLLVRQFLDPNVTPLKIKVNDEIHMGWGAVALKAETEVKATDAGIHASREIEAYPDSRTGQVVINSEPCKLHLNEIYNLKENESWKINIKRLYENVGSISTDCLFDINFNNDHSLKNGATVLVTVFQEPWLFLPAPAVSVDHNVCFEFSDQYVIGVVVNEERSKINKKKLCVKKASYYNVEGYTSRYRSFYGEYDGKNWVVMK